MRLATWNVNSVRARAPRLFAWLDAHPVDVVCLQETKVIDEEFPILEFHARGYQVATFGQRTYNGVAIASKLPLTDVLLGLADGVDDPQARLISATVRCELGEVRVFSAYVPNGEAPASPKFQYKLAWLGRLRGHLDRFHSPKDLIVVVGDLNVAPEPIDCHDPEAWEGRVLFHPAERAALEQVRAFGLVDVYRRHHPEPGRYSWWDYRMLAFPKNRGLRIDHVLATSGLADRSTAAEIDREARKGQQPSDHAPVVVTFDAGT